MDYPEFEDQGQVDIKNLVAQYEEALANDREPMLDQEEAEQIADYYETTGHYDKALRTIDATLGHHPYSGLILLKKAQILFDLKIIEDAEECLEQAEVFEPGEIGIYLLRSEIYTFRSLHKKALAVLKYAESLADTDEKPGIWLHRADVYEDWERYDKVYQSLKECLLIEPANEEALSRLNYCMEINDCYEDAIEFHLKLIDHEPFSFWAWYNLAYAYAALELFEKAIDAMEYVLAIDEEATYAYKDIAGYYFEAGQYEKALEAIAEHAARTKPDTDALLLEGRCQFELGQLRASRYSFRTAIRTHPSNDEAFYHLGMTYMAESKGQQALQHLRKAVELQPDRIEYLEQLAEAGLQNGLHEEVRYCCSRALLLNNRYSRIYITLAMSFFLNNELPEALETIERGILDCGGDSTLRYLRAGILLVAGQRKAAFSDFDDLLDTHFDAHQALFVYLPFLEEDTALMNLIADHDR